MSTPEEELLRRIGAELASVRSMLHPGGGSMAGLADQASARFVIRDDVCIDVIQESPTQYWVAVSLEPHEVYSTDDDVQASADDIRDLIVAIDAGRYEARRGIFGSRLVVRTADQTWKLRARDPFSEPGAGNLPI